MPMVRARIRSRKSGKMTSFDPSETDYGYPLYTYGQYYGGYPLYTHPPTLATWSGVDSVPLSVTPGTTPGPEAVGSTQADQSSTYQYLVKFISCTKKSKYITRVWHGVGNVFESLIQLQEKVMEDFPDKLPSSPTFEIGYIEKRNNAKRWVENTADLTAMYIFQPGSTVSIWCESKDDSTSTDITNTTASARRKHKVTSEKDTGGSSSKRTSLSHEEDVDEFMEKLRDKHLEEGKYTEPQLRLWARMLARGHHQSLENPPNIPSITGAVATKKTPGRDELSDVVVTAMKAASQYFSVATKPSDQLSLNLESTPRAAAGISPSSKAKISGIYLSHLKSLQELRASGTLTEEEFIEQNKYALQNIKGLNNK